jgi:hypothetical protein
MLLIVTSATPTLTSRAFATPRVTAMSKDPFASNDFPANGALGDDALDHVVGGLMGRSFSGLPKVDFAAAAEDAERKAGDVAAHYFHSIAPRPASHHGGGRGPGHGHGGPGTH